MIKARKKSISILLTVAFIVTMLLPVGGAFAADNMYSCPNPKSVTDDSTAQGLGSVFIDLPGGLVQDGDVIEIELPSDYDVYDEGAAGYTNGVDWVVDTVNTTTAPIGIAVPATVSGDDNELDDSDVTADITDENTLELTINTPSGAGSDDGTFIRVYFNMVDIADGASGDITASITGYGAFNDGSVVIGNVVGGSATVAIKDTTNLSGDSDIEDVTITEKVAGALDEGEDSVKLVLPKGFTWADAGTVTASGGFDANADVVSSLDGDDTITLEVVDDSDGTKGKITLSSLRVLVDESEADYGDIVLKVKGESDLAPTTLVIGTYGELGEKVEAADPETVIAGKFSQAIADITVSENVAGSLVDGRNITFKLPTNAKWTAIPEDADDSDVTLDFVGFVGDDGRTIKYEIDGTSSDAAEVELTDFEIALEPGVTGDVVVTVGGSQGIKDEITVAKAVANVTATVEKKAEVKIGVQSQVISDIKIVEGDAEAIADDKDLIVELPSGVKFAAVPTVKVDGDIDIDESGVKRAESDSQLIIPIDNTSNDPSTITLSDVKLTVDRTVAEGEIVAKIKGDAAVEVNDVDAIADEFGNDANGGDDAYSIDVSGNGVNDNEFLALGDDDANTPTEGFFPTSTTAFKVAIANVATPAPGETTASASFVIGSTTYKLNGVDTTMDVAPYIKDGRTYMPIRYVAYALGVSDNNILWDGSTGKVTLIKGDKVVQLTIGSKVLLVNGATITMDVAPEITSDRTMLPIRHVAEVLGAKVGWDEASQTVTIN